MYLLLILLLSFHVGIVARGQGALKMPSIGDSIKYLQNPLFIGYICGKEYVIDGNDIYIRKTYQGAWYFKERVPFDIANGTIEMLPGDSLLFSRNDNTLLYYSLKDKKITAINRDTLFRNFSAKPVTTIIFENASSGCYHGYYDELIYTLGDGGNYELSGYNSAGTKHTCVFRNYDYEIAGDMVYDFAQQVPELLYEHTKAGSIGFTESDYKESKKAFLDFAKNMEFYDSSLYWGMHRVNKTSLNFKRISRLIDSIKDLSPQVLDSCLMNSGEMISTSSTTIGIKLANEDGQVLYIYHRSYEPNSLNFPWTIQLNGYSISKNDISVNNFIKKAYPSWLGEKSHSDIIEQIVQSLYFR